MLLKMYDFYQRKNWVVRKSKHYAIKNKSFFIGKIGLFKNFTTMLLKMNVFLKVY